MPHATLGKNVKIINLAIPAWMADVLRGKQTWGWHKDTHTRTHTQLDAGNNNTRRQKLASGKNSQGTTGIDKSSNNNFDWCQSLKLNCLNRKQGWKICEPHKPEGSDFLDILTHRILAIWRHKTKWILDLIIANWLVAPNPSSKSILTYHLWSIVAFSYSPGNFTKLFKICKLRYVWKVITDITPTARYDNSQPIITDTSLPSMSDTECG